MKLSIALLVIAVGTSACASASAKPDAALATNEAASKKSALPSSRLANTDTEFNAPISAATVGDVLKGDELTLRDGTEIRLIGIKTPIAAFSQRQGNFYGKGALELSKQLVAWKDVRLEYDKQTHDRRGRLLAYVYVNGKLLQEELLRNGHAFAETFPPNVKFRDQFLAWQQEAMTKKKGMWGLNPKDYPQENKIDEYLIEGVVVKRVINGDSIELEDGSVVRLIGIDAPDSENRFREGQVGHAAYKAHKALLEGKTINIEYDIEAKDPQGRELAWVFVDKELINASLVRDGHAIVAVFPPNVKYLDVLFKAQGEAAKAKKGLWSGNEQ